MSCDLFCILVMAIGLRTDPKSFRDQCVEHLPRNGNFVALHSKLNASTSLVL